MKKLYTFIVSAVVVVGAVVMIASNNSQTVVNPIQVVEVPVAALSTPVATPKPTVGTPTPASAPVADKPKNLVYKNGTYTATGSYDSPAGMEDISITLTIKNDVIAAASGSNQANDETSYRYESIFLSNFQPYVVGKSVDSVQLDRVSRSSLTPAGFNDALDKIKAQAKA